MDETFPIRIIRDVVNRIGLRHLQGIYVRNKSDGSQFTDIDPLVESIVLEHVHARLKGSDLKVVAEESGDESRPTMRELKSAKFIVTVDGVDGTGAFARHFNSLERNSKWLLGLTAIYQAAKEPGRFSPLLSFAYQPNEDRLFAFVNGLALQINDPLGKATIIPLSVDNLKVDKEPRGTIDVYLDKSTCEYTIAPSVTLQKGPSGFNMASLAASCSAPTYGTKPVNFTTFHYTMWDFGLWPVLNAAGFQTYLFGDKLPQNSLCIDDFDSDGEFPGKVRRPLIICLPKHYSQICSALQHRPK